MSTSAEIQAASVHTDPVITHLVERLNRTDLQPGPEVNALFNDLVALALTAGREHTTIHDPIALAELRRICALGETRLEQFWAAQIRGLGKPPGQTT